MNLALAERAELAANVYDYVFDNTESLEDDCIGADLAYLMGAILKNSFCEWPEARPLVRLLRHCDVAEREPLFGRFIQISDPNEE